jgi:hypothetical protein
MIRTANPPALGSKGRLTGRRPAHLWTKLARLTPLIASLLLASGTASAQTTDGEPQGSHCLNKPQRGLYLEQTLGGVATPLGAENQMSLTWCTPLIRKPHVLFDYTNIELGFTDYTSPAYTQQGIFARIIPLSLIQLFGEITALVIWPVNMEATGHYELSGYDADFSGSALPGDEAVSSFGWAARGGAALRAGVDIGPTEVLVLNKFMAEYWSMRSDGFYYHLRNDLPLRSQDLVLNNMGLAVLGIPVHPNVNLRIGLMDELYYVPESGHLSNIAAGVVTFNVAHAGKWIVDLQPLVRIGYRTHHPIRAGQFHVLTAINLYYDFRRRKNGQVPPQ